MAGRRGVCFRSKNDLASVAGVTGVAGPLLSTDEVSLPAWVRKLRSIVEKSESLPDEIDPVEDPEMLRISGAVRAWTLVVEISSVGREMRLRSMVPGAYLTVVLRCMGTCSVLRLTRLVNAREIDIFREVIEGESKRPGVFVLKSTRVQKATEVYELGSGRKRSWVCARGEYVGVRFPCVEGRIR